MIYLLYFASFISAGSALYFSYKDKIIALYGAALYVLMPYRIYVCFDIKDIGQSIFWAVLPLIFACLVKAYDKSIGKKSFIWLLPAAALLAILSRADAVLVVIGSIILIFAGVLLRKFFYVAVSMTGLIGSFVINTDYWKFVLRGHINREFVDSVLIAGKGYYFGKYFMSWEYFENLPGLGFGLLLSLLLICGYLIRSFDVSENDDKNTERDKMIAKVSLIAVLLAAVAFHWGFWDIIERAHPIMERFISSIASPNVFFGYGCAVLCIPASLVAGKLWNAKKQVVSKIIPLFILGMNICAAIFQIVRLR